MDTGAMFMEAAAVMDNGAMVMEDMGAMIMEAAAVMDTGSYMY